MILYFPFILYQVPDKLIILLQPESVKEESIMHSQLSKILTITALIFILLFSFTQHAFAVDMDGDGLEDPADNCLRIPNGPVLGTCTAGDVSNTCTSDADCGTEGSCSMDQEDSDLDSFGDACDFCEGNGNYDTDEDGLCDREDNCHSVFNPGQEDTDGDGYGDVCTNRIPMFNVLQTFEGSYEEIGRQVAHTYPDTIFFAAVDVFMAIGVTPQLAQDYYDAIEDEIPQSIKDYMQGMALGLTEARFYSYETARDIVLVNTFAINILSMPSPTSLANDQFGCTAFAVSSEAGTFLAHNTDNQKGTEHKGGLMVFKPDNGDNSYIHLFTPAFVDVGLGLNDKGIAITYNVGNPNVNATTGLPPLFMVRHAMEKASTLDQVVSYFKDFVANGNTFGHGGAIFLVVDFNDNSMAKIQVRSEKVKVTYGEDLKPGVKYLATTNHFDEDFRDDPDYYYESSFKRFERLMELLPALENYDLDSCWSVLSDHGDGTPDNNTISRDGVQTGTTVSNIFTADKVYYTLGRPHAYLNTYGEAIVIDFGGKLSPGCSVEEIYGEYGEKTELLRHFRDNILSKTSKGQEIIRLYYAWSPAIVKAMQEDEEFKKEVREMIEEILPLVRKTVK